MHVKSLIKFAFLNLSILVLCSCLGGLWTGATMVYDRHSLHKKFDDLQLGTEVRNMLRDAGILSQPDNVLDFCAFNGDVLVAGHVPSKDVLDRINRVLQNFSGYRRLLVKITIQRSARQEFTDAWITTKIRSGMMMDDAINPQQFKITTVDGIVYIMGDVMPDQAKYVVDIARETEGVLHVVTWMQYYSLNS